MRIIVEYDKTRNYHSVRIIRVLYGKSHDIASTRFLVLYCTVLHYIILYYIILYCIVLYYIILYSIILYYIELYCIILCCVVYYHSVRESINVLCIRFCIRLCIRLCIGSFVLDHLY